MLFFSVRLKIDIFEIILKLVWILAAVLGLIFVKSAVLPGLVWLFRLPWSTAVETGLLLGSGGEFAFVGIGMAIALRLITAEAANFTLTAAAISMARMPAFWWPGRGLSLTLREVKKVDAQLLVCPEVSTGQAIVIGCGRVGRLVRTMLERNRLDFIAIDSRARIVPNQRRKGDKVFFGDASDPEFLMTCGLADAKAVVVTVSVAAEIDAIVTRVRMLRPDVIT